MDPGDPPHVSEDPFFAEVRRRHPDIDIVLLPPEVEPEEPPRANVEDLAGAPDRCEADLAAVWALVANGIEPPHPDSPHQDSRWASGPVTGSVRREAVVGVEGVDVVAALQALAGAERALVDAGWHVLAPAEGMPRVLAGAPDGAEAEVVFVPARGRYLVTHRSPPMAVGAETAVALLRGRDDRV